MSCTTSFKGALASSLMSTTKQKLGINTVFFLRLSAQKSKAKIFKYFFQNNPREKCNLVLVPPQMKPKLDGNACNVEIIIKNCIKPSLDSGRRRHWREINILGITCTCPWSWEMVKAWSESGAWNLHGHGDWYKKKQVNRMHYGTSPPLLYILFKYHPPTLLQNLR